MPQYRFEEIAINSTEKKKPVEADKDTYLGLEHLDTGCLHVTRWGSEVAPIGDKLIMRKGDVLFGRRRAYQKKVAIAPFDGIFSAHGMVLRPRTEVITERFFPFFISSDYFLDAAINISVGSLSPTINWRDLKELTFNIPPLDEQDALADELWAFEDTKEAYNRLMAATDALVKSQFIEMFYDKGYAMETIGNVIATDIQRVGKVFLPEDEIQYLDISSINNDTKAVISTTKYKQKAAPSRAQYVLKKGDILYSTVRPNLQNIAINPYCDENVVGSTGFCILRCTRVSTGFMWGLITSDLFTESMVSMASGANYPAVTDAKVHSYEFPLPPLELQERFAAFVESTDKSKFATGRNS